ncbi:pegasus-like [Hyalella azteca]|uniref:Pegasus-like n=1 Tax=Hyalella azteca TaxID=294128 RepID=A0A6A0H2U6_HYAAZ|nr:pegasus-like [Hyalella azteca]
MWQREWCGGPGSGAVTVLYCLQMAAPLESPLSWLADPDVSSAVLSSAPGRLAINNFTDGADLLTSPQSCSATRLLSPSTAFSSCKLPKTRPAFVAASEMSLPKFDVFRDGSARRQQPCMEASPAKPTISPDRFIDSPLFPGLMRTLSSDIQHNVEVNARGERIFYCMFCPYNSTRSDTLKVHIRIHTGEKPYSCKLCSYRCNQKSQLSRHIASKHSTPS